MPSLYGYGWILIENGEPGTVIESVGRWIRTISFRLIPLMHKVILQSFFFFFLFNLHVYDYNRQEFRDIFSILRNETKECLVKLVMMLVYGLVIVMCSMNVSIENRSSTGKKKKKKSFRSLRFAKSFVVNPSLNTEKVFPSLNKIYIYTF